VLALLVLDAGRVVPAGQLAEALWQGRPPSGAAKTLRSYLSRLRGVLAPEIAVTARGGGYTLIMESGQVDAGRFERLVGAGQGALGLGEAAPAAGRFAEALALWRGPALVDVADVEPLAREAARLEELRLVAVEGHAEAGIALGLHGEVVATLAGSGRPAHDGAGAVRDRDVLEAGRDIQTRGCPCTGRNARPVTGRPPPLRLRTRPRTCRRPPAAWLAGRGGEPGPPRRSTPPTTPAPPAPAGSPATRAPRRNSPAARSNTSRPPRRPRRPARRPARPAGPDRPARPPARPSRRYGTAPTAAASACTSTTGTSRTLRRTAPGHRRWRG